jgi:hypothetical protein
MPVTFTPQQRQALLNVLGRGRASAITARTLAQTLGYPIAGTQPKLRKLIKECIEHDMDLIGASTGRPKGFFMINTVAEFDIYIDNLEGRIRSNNNRRNALIAQWNAANPATTRSPLTIT